MSLHLKAQGPGVYSPAEIAYLRDIVGDVARAPHRPELGQREAFASLVIRAYDRGVRCPERLKAFAAVAARLYFTERRDVASSDQPTARFLSVSRGM